MRWFIGIFIACVVLVAGYYGSALYTLSRLAAAARAGDGATIAAHTNLPRLSGSLSDQIVAAYLERIGATRRVGALERTLVWTYGASVADALVTKILTPANLAELLKTGQINDPSAPASVFHLPALAELQKADVLEQLGRLHFVTPVQISIRISATTDPEHFAALILHRDGLDWNLSGVTLPRSLARRLAESLPTR